MRIIFGRHTVRNKRFLSLQIAGFAHAGAHICVYARIMRSNICAHAITIYKKFSKILDAHAYARYNKYIYNYLE